jgi:hypothetical protein
MQIGKGGLGGKPMLNLQSSEKGFTVASVSRGSQPWGIAGVSFVTCMGPTRRPFKSLEDTPRHRAPPNFEYYHDPVTEVASCKAGMAGTPFSTGFKTRRTTDGSERIVVLLGRS